MPRQGDLPEELWTVTSLTLSNKARLTFSVLILSDLRLLCEQFGVCVQKIHFVNMLQS